MRSGSDGIEELTAGENVPLTKAKLDVPQQTSRQPAILHSLSVPGEQEDEKVERQNSLDRNHRKRLVQQPRIRVQLCRDIFDGGIGMYEDDGSSVWGVSLHGEEGLEHHVDLFPSQSATTM